MKVSLAGAGFLTGRFLLLVPSGAASTLDPFLGDMVTSFDNAHD
jgi:hypothetical protein